MVRSQLFSRIKDKREVYFLRRQRLEKSDNLDPLICASFDKNRIFEDLAHYEKLGVPCYVEDREGKRLS